MRDAHGGGAQGPPRRRTRGAPVRQGRRHESHELRAVSETFLGRVRVRHQGARARVGGGASEVATTDGGRDGGWYLDAVRDGAGDVQDELRGVRGGSGADVLVKGVVELNFFGN